MPTQTARETDHGASLSAYPNLSRAAEMIGVSSSTLSRRDDLQAERRGERDRVLRPSEVLRLAMIHRKRSLTDVAQDLFEHAQEVAPEQLQRVEDEIDHFFETQAVTEVDVGRFMDFLRSRLPVPLYKEVERVLAEKAEPLPGWIEGYLPLPKN